MALMNLGISEVAVVMVYSSKHSSCMTISFCPQCEDSDVRNFIVVDLYVFHVIAKIVFRLSRCICMLLSVSLLS